MKNNQDFNNILDKNQNKVDELFDNVSEYNNNNYNIYNEDDKNNTNKLDDSNESNGTAPINNYVNYDNNFKDENNFNLLNNSNNNNFLNHKKSDKLNDLFGSDRESIKHKESDIFSNIKNLQTNDLIKMDNNNVPTYNQNAFINNNNFVGNNNIVNSEQKNPFDNSIVENNIDNNIRMYKYLDNNISNNQNLNNQGEFAVNNSLCLNFNDISYLNNAVKEQNGKDLLNEKLNLNNTNINKNDDFISNFNSNYRNNINNENENKIKNNFNDNDFDFNNNNAFNINKNNKLVDDLTYQNYSKNNNTNNNVRRKNTNNSNNAFNFIDNNIKNNNNKFDFENNRINNNNTNNLYDKESNYNKNQNFNNSDNNSNYTIVNNNYFNKLKINTTNNNLTAEKEEGIGVFSKLTIDDNMNLLNESIFTNKKESIKSSYTFSNFNQLDSLCVFLDKNIQSPYLGELDPEALSLENTILFDDIKTTNNSIYSADLTYVMQEIKYENLKSYVIGPLIKTSINKTFSYVRDTLSDGDSFYRSFIFKYIENCILSNNTYRINKLFYNLYNNFVKSFPNIIKHKNKKLIIDIKENIDVVLITFYNIIELLNKKDISNAYEYFVKSYLLKMHLDIVLIAYTRYVIIDFINQNEVILQEFDIYYPNLNNTNEIKPFIYQTNSGYDYKLLQKELSFFHTEAHPFYIVILSYALETNISITSGFFNLNNIYFDKKEIIPKVECFIKDNSNKIPSVTLYVNNLFDNNYNNNNNSNNIYNETGLSLGFNISYDLKDLSLNKVNINVLERVYNFSSLNLNINSIYFISNLENKSIANKCSICNKQNSKLYSKIPEVLSNNKAYCVVCLEEIIKNNINNRLRLISKEKYLYQECN